MPTLHLDASTLFLSLVTGGVGFVLFVYGKKQGRWPHLVTGLLFMAYPYFISGVLATVGIGVALGVGLWFASREGW